MINLLGLGILFLFSALPLSPHVEVCETPVIDPLILKALLEVEFSRFPKQSLNNLSVSFDNCTNTSVRIRIKAKEHEGQTTVPWVDMPRASRHRTLAILTVDLWREAYSFQENAEFGPESLAEPQKPKEQEAKNQTTEADEIKPVTRAEGGEGNNSLRGKKYLGMATSFSLIRFSSPGTFVPAISLSLEWPHWFLGLRGMGTTESHELGRVFLGGATLFSGTRILRIPAFITTELDAAVEAGSVFAHGEPKVDAEGATSGSWAAGFHLHMRAALPLQSPWEIFTLFDAGWLRGINVYAEESKISTLNGVFFSLGLGLSWQRR